MDELFPIICRDAEQVLMQRAYKDGFGLTSFARHRKEIQTIISEETGEMYEVCVITSHVDIAPLKDRNNA